MFDMNRLFEEFVYEFMNKNRAKLGIKRISEQKVLGKLYDEFNMYYDILMEDARGNTILIDTKYKIPVRESRHKGLAQSDFYQMFAYSTSQPQKYSNVVLLYPKTAVIHESDYVHQLDGAYHKLAVRGVGLEKIWNSETNRLDEIALISDLTRCLNLMVS